MIQWLLENFNAAAAFQFGCVVAVAAVLGILVDMAKRRPADIRFAEPTETPLSLMSRTRRYELWRKELAAWTDNDGTSIGLDALLDRWRGVSHDKPKNKIEETVWDLEDVGLLSKETPKPKTARIYNTADECYCACSVLFPAAGCNCPCHNSPPIQWKSNPFKDGELDRLLAGGDSARLRFFELNRKSARARVLADEAKAAAFRETFAGPENAGKTLDAQAWSYTRKDGVVFKRGQWVRIMSDRGLAAGFERLLFQIDQSLAPFGLMVRGFDGRVAVSEYEIEPALPRNGEWWILANMSGVIPFQVSEQNDRQRLDEWALKGEMVPVNFGRGQEAKG